MICPHCNNICEKKTQQRNLSLKKELIDKEIHENFMKNYGYAYWFFKVQILEYIINNYDKQPEIQKLFIDIVSRQPIEKSAVLITLKAEIFFTLFHITESLFALILAALQKPPLTWFWLYKYKPYEVNNFIEKIRKKEFVFSYEGLSELFFYPDKPLDDTKTNLQKNIVFVKEFLPLLAEEYLDNKFLYNSYKHGLRLLWGELNIRANNAEIITDTFIYLREVTKTSNTELHRVIENFDWKRAYNLVMVTYAILQSIFIARRQHSIKSEDSTVIRDLSAHDVKKLFKKEIHFKDELNLSKKDDRNTNFEVN